MAVALESRPNLRRPFIVNQGRRLCCAQNAPAQRRCLGAQPSAPPTSSKPLFWRSSTSLAASVSREQIIGAHQHATYQASRNNSHQQQQQQQQRGRERQQAARKQQVGQLARSGAPSAATPVAATRRASAAAIKASAGAVSAATTNSRLRQGALYARRQAALATSNPIAPAESTPLTTSQRRQQLASTLHKQRLRRGASLLAVATLAGPTRSARTTHSQRARAPPIASMLAASSCLTLANANCQAKVQLALKHSAYNKLTSSTSSLTLAVVKRPRQNPPPTSHKGRRWSTGIESDAHTSSCGSPGSSASSSTSLCSSAGAAPAINMTNRHRATSESRATGGCHEPVCRLAPSAVPSRHTGALVRGAAVAAAAAAAAAVVASTRLSPTDALWLRQQRAPGTSSTVASAMQAKHKQGQQQQQQLQQRRRSSTDGQNRPVGKQQQQPQPQQNEINTSTDKFITTAEDIVAADNRNNATDISLLDKISNISGNTNDNNQRLPPRCHCHQPTETTTEIVSHCQMCADAQAVDCSDKENNDCRHVSDSLQLGLSRELQINTNTPNKAIFADIPIKLEPISELYHLEARPFARGKFAQVKRCVRKDDSSKCYAAKCIKKRRRQTDIRHEILLEIEALKLSYETKYIVMLYEVYETPSEMILLLEMANGGELQRVLDDEEQLDEPIARRYVRQILDGLIYLHDNHIAHLDIKPQNLLLTEPYPNGDIKLCDFGISRRITEGCEIRDICGTPDYVAPEILRYDPISLATDMWSMGVLTYVLLSGYSPFGSESKQQTFCNITQGALDFPAEIFEKISQEAVDFVRSLIVRDPGMRMTSRHARKHPWVMTADLAK